MASKNEGKGWWKCVKGAAARAWNIRQRGQLFRHDLAGDSASTQITRISFKRKRRVGWKKKRLWSRGNDWLKSWHIEREKETKKVLLGA